MRIPFRKTEQPPKKITWAMRLASFFSRSRSLAIFGGLVALLGGARALRRRTSNA